MRHNKFLKKENITINDLIKKYGIIAVLLASIIVIISEFLGKQSGNPRPFNDRDESDR